MSSNGAMTNGGDDATVTLSVKELKSKFSGPPLAPQPKALKSPTRKEPLKSPTSVTSPIRKTEFAVGKSNIHIQEKVPNQKGYQVTGKVTTAKPGSKVSELAKMYPHPHPVLTQQQQNINQQMYTRSNSKPESKSTVVNGVAAAPPTIYTTPPRVKTPTTPVTVVPWDKQNEIEVQESVRERISRLNSTEGVVEPKPLVRASNKPESPTNLEAGSGAPQDEIEQGYRVENGGSDYNNYDDDDNNDDDDNDNNNNCDDDDGGRGGSNYDRDDYRNSEDADEVPNGHYENDEEVQEQDYGNDKNDSEPEDETYERDDDREPSPAPEPDSYDRSDDRDPSPEPEDDNYDHNDPPGYSDNEEDARDN